MVSMSDNEIKESVDKGTLIKNYNVNQIMGACYELRFGNVYYDLTESDKPIILQEGQSALIKPGHRVVLITHEELIVPSSCIVRIFSKGSFFSLGLSSVATYADPGFEGNIGIVTQNMSDKYIEIPAMESIAKAEFAILSSDATNLYKGQHGYKTNIWPIKHHLLKDYNDVKGRDGISSEIEEAYKILPKATVSIIRKLEDKQKRIDIGLIAFITINVVILIMLNNEMISSIYAIIINLLSSLIAYVFVSFTRDN